MLNCDKRSCLNENHTVSFVIRISSNEHEWSHIGAVEKTVVCNVRNYLGSWKKPKIPFLPIFMNGDYLTGCDSNSLKVYVLQLHMIASEFNTSAFNIKRGKC